MPRLRKYIPWKRVESLDDLDAYLDEGNRYFFGLYCAISAHNSKPYHSGWVMSQHLRTLRLAITERTLWVSNPPSSDRYELGGKIELDSVFYVPELEGYYRVLELPEGRSRVLTAQDWSGMRLRHRLPASWFVWKHAGRIVDRLWFVGGFNA